MNALATIPRERKSAVSSDAGYGCTDFCILDRNLAAWSLVTHFPSKVNIQDSSQHLPKKRNQLLAIMLRGDAEGPNLRKLAKSPHLCFARFPSMEVSSIKD